MNNDKVIWQVLIHENFQSPRHAIQTEYVTYWKVEAFANDVECLFHFQFTPFMCSQSLLQNHTNYECSLRSKVKYILHKDVSRWRTWKHKGKRKNLVNETVEYCHQWHKNFVWDTLQLLWHWFLNKFRLQEVLQSKHTEIYHVYLKHQDRWNQVHTTRLPLQI